MRKIVLFGAGKSAYSLINYILNHAKEQSWQLTIADLFPEKVAETYQNDALTVVPFSIEDEATKDRLIADANIVVSMLPARFHPIIATTCLAKNKNLITPSYISDEMKAIGEEAESKGLIFLNEIGLDPGIDHMSAMQIIHHLKDNGKNITAFESFCGGLIAPESDNNPWHYKFTWNPRNVVLAGQGGAVQFLHNGKYKYIPYHKLFDRTEIISVDGYGDFEGYANRDSLKYIESYGLKGIQTMYRGTLRRQPFSKAWHILVQLGATDDSYTIGDSENMTYRQFTNSFLKYREGDSVELKLAYYLHKDVDSEEMKLLKWTGIFSDEKIGLKNASPAQILQKLLVSKLSLEPNDKDMIVMRHLFKYNDGTSKKQLESSMVVLGDDEQNTAMAKTVGLPIAIAIKLILNDKIKSRGVLMPTIPEIYTPILKELLSLGIIFNEKEVEL